VIEQTRAVGYRWVGVAGVVVAALLIGSFAIVFPGAPEADRSNETILDWYDDSANQARYVVVAVLGGLAVIAFLVFLVGFRGLLLDIGARATLVDLAYAGGLAFAVLALVGIAVGSTVAATFIYSDTFELDPDTARIVLMIGNVWMPTIAGAPGSLFVGASCLALRDTGFRPLWPVRLGYVVTLLALVPLFGVNSYLVALWVLLFSIVVVRRPGFRVSMP
jgi:hypothetical protein